MKPKSTILSIISIMLIILVGCSASRVRDKQAADEKLIKDAVIADISNFETETHEAEISFPQFRVEGDTALVEIFLLWGPKLGVSYVYNLKKESGRWVIVSRERGIAL